MLVIKVDGKLMHILYATPAWVNAPLGPPHLKMSGHAPADEAY